MKSMTSPLLFSACLALLSGTAHATLVYSNNFDNAAFIATGVSANGLTAGALGSATGGPYNGANGKSWNGNYFNGLGTASTLTLNGLPQHSTTSIDMLLGFLNSWDSLNGVPSPDKLDIYADGNLLLSMTTVTASGNVVDLGGGALIVDNGQIDGSVFFSDDLVDMATAPSLTFAHSASTLSLTILPSGAGWQGWPDEGWGVDSLSIEISGNNGIPTPATLMLLSLGIAGLALKRRKQP